MADLVTPAELSQALHTFAGYVDDLARVEFDAASTKLRLVVNYASRDRTIRPLTELLRRQIPSAELFERAGGERLDVPRGGLARLAFRYDLLFHLKDGHKLNVRELLTREDFAGGGMPHRWRAFQELLVAPLRDDIQALVRWIRDALGSERIEPGEAVDRAIAAVIVGQADDASATLGRSTPEFVALEAAVRAADLPARREANLLTDVAIFEVELSKTAPDPERLAELTRALGCAGAAVTEALTRCAAKASAPAQPEPAARPEPEAQPQPVAPSANDDELTSERLGAARAAFAAERQAFAAERQAFEVERQAFAVECEAAREAIAAERRALDARRGALDARRDSLDARREALERRRPKG